MIKNYFLEETHEEIKSRLNNLKFDQKPKWGKMNAAQMLRHLTIPMEIELGRREPVKIPFLIRLLLKKTIRETVLSEKPYKHNSRTPEGFVVSDERDFEKEKALLLKLMSEQFEVYKDKSKVWHMEPFGPITPEEVSTMNYKHIDHHFSQFGV